MTSGLERRRIVRRGRLIKRRSAGVEESQVGCQGSIGKRCGSKHNSRQDPSGATINRTLVTTYTEDLSYGIFNGWQGVWQSSGFQNVHVGGHCQIFEERRSDPKIRSLEDRCLTPGEAAFVREHQHPAVSDYDRTLIIPGSTYDNRAMASIKDKLEAAAKVRERELAAEASDLKSLTDLARAVWGPK